MVEKELSGFTVASADVEDCAFNAVLWQIDGVPLLQLVLQYLSVRRIEPQVRKVGILAQR